MSLENHRTNSNVVLITGASSGIGQACAELLAHQGYRVYGTSRKPGPAPAPYVLLELDVTREDSVQRAVAQVLEREGCIDVLVNNAGYALAGSIEDTSLEEAQRQLDTNFFGVIRMCQAVLPSMRARRSGLILNVGSLGGRVGLPFQAAYSASKFALEGLTESLRMEVRPFGIRVAVLELGDVRTPITDNRIVAAQARAGSPYSQAFASALKVIEHEERAGATAENIARRLLALLRVQEPRVRYTAGALLQRFFIALKPLLPSRVFEAVLMKIYGL